MQDVWQGADSERVRALGWLWAGPDGGQVSDPIAGRHRHRGNQAGLRHHALTHSGGQASGSLQGFESEPQRYPSCLNSLKLRFGGWCSSYGSNLSVRVVTGL